MQRERPRDPAQRPEQRRRRKKRAVWKEILSWVISIALVLVVTRLVHTFVFQPVRVDGESMRNTLQDNEYMIATKWDYLVGAPNRFDVVICHYPDPAAMREMEVAQESTPMRRSGGLFNTAENFVKRVVGLPGEELEIRKGELYINGEWVPQNFDKTESQRDFGPVTVPEDHYFVIGDNRNNSHDSRYDDVGPLPTSMIIGHVRFVAFPLSAMRGVETPSMEGTPPQEQEDAGLVAGMMKE